MKKIALASTLLVLSLALVGLATTGALAQTDKPQTSVTGTITKMSSDDFVLQTDQGELRFDMSHKTVKPATLAVGQKITVWYDEGSDTKHELDANRVEMFTEPTPAPTTQAPPPAQEPPPTETQTTTPSQETQTTQETPLPKTASPLPLMGAVGLLSLLGSGLLLRQPK